jgi:hypothetical protein
MPTATPVAQAAAGETANHNPRCTVCQLPLYGADRKPSKNGVEVASHDDLIEATPYARRVCPTTKSVRPDDAGRCGAPVRMMPEYFVLGWQPYRLSFFWLIKSGFYVSHFVR